MENYFGTDGIRGIYPTEINEGIAYNLATALADEDTLVVVAKDTRLSGNKLLSALCYGVYDSGGTVVNLGVLPSNAVAHFTRKLGADYGIMITASHNPPCYNGLKVFDSFGVKLCERKQREISAKMQERKIHFAKQISKEKVYTSAKTQYVNDLLSFVKADLTSLNIMCDCAYGSAYGLAQRVFSKAKANVTCFNDKNCGKLINHNCGAVYPEFLLGKMAKDTRLGFCIDGDADRLVVLEQGVALSGDRIFYAFCKYFAEKNLLSSSAAVGTILTNKGLENALAQLGISLLRSDVGDIKMSNLMAERGINVGGEDSGHYLLFDYATSSDALLNALFVAKIYAEKGSILNYTSELALLPTATENISMSRSEIDKIVADGILNTLSSAFAQKFPSCRLVLRKSGTEPKIRIYIEGQQDETAHAIGYVKSEIEKTQKDVNS